MTLTDEQIEKALADRMKELEDSRDGHIRTAAEKDVEIERLNKEVDRLSQVVLYNDGVTEMLISEARKEFASKVARMICACPSIDNDTYNELRRGVYDLLKEMEGE